MGLHPGQSSDQSTVASTMEQHATPELVQLHDGTHGT